jgi:drug/metabolite transporter (DMT)-like permease
MWSFLALLTVGASHVPALQLNAICFTIGGVIGLVWGWKTGTLHQLRTISWQVYAFGTLGLFGYHFLYFTALRLAPPAEAGLIAYLWPLLIVLFSGLLPGEKLKSGHVFGAVIAFIGAGMIVARGGIGVNFDAIPGYALAFLCALTWSGYSLISRKLGRIPTSAVTVYCLAAALLSIIAHLALETTIWPSDPFSWASVIALGMGPVGLAFFTWDVGVKRGDIQMLGTASYAAPLFSTLILVVAGVTAASANLLLAAALIASGAAFAARASHQR